LALASASASSPVVGVDLLPDDDPADPLLVDPLRFPDSTSKTHSRRKEGLKVPRRGQAS
jgi:hypothetical protein